eukprot:1941346-Prymnesium_polylepis.1
MGASSRRSSSARILLRMCVASGQPSGRRRPSCLSMCVAVASRAGRGTSERCARATGLGCCECSGTATPKG